MGFFSNLIMKHGAKKVFDGAKANQASTPPGFPVGHTSKVSQGPLSSESTLPVRKGGVLFSEETSTSKVSQGPRSSGGFLGLLLRKKLLADMTSKKSTLG